MNDKKTCCVIGNLYKEIPWHYKKVSNWCEFHYLNVIDKELEKLIQQGYDYFITDATYGVGFDASHVILNLKDYYFDHVQFEIAVPYAQQHKKFPKRARKFYKEFAQYADFVSVFQEKKTRNARLNCNKNMIDRSDLVVFFWDEKDTGLIHKLKLYAQEKGKEIKIYNLWAILHEAESFVARTTSSLKQFLKECPPEKAPAPSPEEIERQEESIRKLTEIIQSVKKKREERLKNSTNDFWKTL